MKTLEMGRRRKFGRRPRRTAGWAVCLAAVAGLLILASGSVLAQEGTDAAPESSPKLEAPPASAAPAAPAPVVRAIQVRGTRHVATEKVFDAITGTRVGEPFSSDKVQSDLGAIYKIGLFQDVSAEVVPDGQGVRVVFQVVENPILAGIEVRLDEPIPGLEGEGALQEIASLIPLPQGEIIDAYEFQKAFESLPGKVWERYGVLTRPSQVNVGDDGTVRVALRPVRVGAVELKGNQKTKDFVILREMTLKPGDVVTQKELEKSMRRVLQLEFFDEVKPDIVEGSDPDKVTVVVEVTERRTGNASFGAGYSSPGGLVGNLEISERNFLGRGQQVNLQLSIGRTSRTYEVGFTEPYLFGTPYSLGFNLYNRWVIQEQASGSAAASAQGWQMPVFRALEASAKAAAEPNNQYKDRRYGGEVTVGRLLSEFTRGFVTLRSETTSIEPLEGSTVGEEQYTIRSLTLAANTNTTDNPFAPTEGYRNQASAEFAGGLLGGQYTFSKYQVSHSRYYKVGSGGQVLAFRLMGGLGAGDMPAQEYFQVGGAETLRGYDFRDFVGDRMLVANAEYRFPVYNPVQGVLFFDAGQAWKPGQDADLGQLKKGFGLGIRINTPIGVLRLDYGIGEEGGKTYFSFGQTF